MTRMSTCGRLLTAGDICLNLWGYIPGVSNISGGVRMSYGYGMGGIGVALFVIGKLGEAASSSHHRKSYAAFWGARLVLNGVCHVARGYVEQVPIAGNGSCMAYDFACLVAGRRIIGYP